MSHNVNYTNFFALMDDIKLLTLLEVEFTIEPQISKFKRVYVKIPMENMAHEKIMECVDMGFDTSYAILTKMYYEVVE